MQSLKREKRDSTIIHFLAKVVLNFVEGFYSGRVSQLEVGSEGSRLSPLCTATQPPSPSPDARGYPVVRSYLQKTHR